MTCCGLAPGGAVVAPFRVQAEAGQPSELGLSLIYCGSALDKRPHSTVCFIKIASSSSACRTELWYSTFSHLFCDFFQDTFDIRILMAKSVKYTVNFLEAKEEDLYKYVSTKCLIVLHLNTSFWYMGKVQKEVCQDGHIFIYPFLAFSRIEIPFKFHMMHSGLVHGLAFWFDVAFIGSM